MYQYIVQLAYSPSCFVALNILCNIVENLLMYDAIIKHEQEFEINTSRSLEERLENVAELYNNFVRAGALRSCIPNYTSCFVSCSPFSFVLGMTPSCMPAHLDRLLFLPFTF
jgi:hypothetical protein